MPPERSGFLERYFDAGPGPDCSLYLFNDPSGHVLEVEKRIIGSPTTEILDQYVRSDSAPT